MASFTKIEPYEKFMRRPILEKSVSSLVGIVQGIALDGKINPIERQYLNAWIEENRAMEWSFLAKELITLVRDAIADDVLTLDEKTSIFDAAGLIIIEKQYFSEETAQNQFFQGILSGVAADGAVSEEEIHKLRGWINDNYHLKGSFPFDEIESICHEVMRDGKIDEAENKMLCKYFSEFQRVLGKNAIDPKELHINGICSMNPEIKIEGNLFCFTGVSEKTGRKEFAELIISKGGKFNDSVIKDTKYLVIGCEGNPCWSFSCYGRKVEKAVMMRKSGQKILLINEIDFWDSL